MITQPIGQIIETVNYNRCSYQPTIIKPNTKTPTTGLATAC